jgi:hypothetical protein
MHAILPSLCQRIELGHEVRNWHLRDAFSMETVLPQLKVDRLRAPVDGTAAPDRQGTSSDRLGDIVLSRAEPSLTALTNAARLDGFSDFIKGKKSGGQLGPESISLEKRRTRERASR